MTNQTTMTAADWGRLVLLSILWGGSFFFNAVAVADMPVLVVVVGRVALAALILWAIVLATSRVMPTDRATWTMFLVMGLINNVVPFSLIVWGQSQIASGLAAILNASTPLFTVLIAHVATADEKITPLRFSGVLAGLAGVAVMIGLSGDVFASGDLFAELACLAAAVSYGFAGIYGRRFRARGVDPLAVATGQVSASSLMLVPLVLVVNPPWTLAMPGIPALLALLAVATFSTALAYVLFFRVLASAGATNLSLVTFLIPVSAILLGIIILGETLEARHLAGMALIGLGLAAIDGRPFRRFFASRREARP